VARKTYLTERDLELLLTLVERRSETLDLLHHRFFAGAKRKTALNRLRALERGGFVRREEVVTFESGGHFHGVYTLGAAAKAALTLRSLAQEHFDGRRFSARLRETSMPHQIATNRVGDWLGARLLPEHLLPAPGRDGTATARMPSTAPPAPTPEAAGSSSSRSTSATTRASGCSASSTPSSPTPRALEAH
jgi:hypothetical protein